MGKRVDLKNKKEKELIEYLKQNLLNLSFSDNITNKSDIYSELVTMGFVNISPPEEDSPIFHYLTIDSLNNYKSGSSIKPGNIVFNFGKLIKSLPELITFEVSIISDIHILRVCAALMLWTKLLDMMTIEITKEQAVVITALWKNCNKDKNIDLKDGFLCTNKLNKDLGETNFRYKKYLNIINQLSEIKCIELNDNTVRLREWISRKYAE